MEGAFRDLLAFERACGFEPGLFDGPNVPGQPTVALRSKLHREEFEELQEAMESGDIAAITKEVLDLIWVCLGTLVRYRVDAPAAWRELALSNMSKDFAGARRGDGKILKGDNYYPANMGRVLLEQWPIAKTYGQESA